MLQFDHPLVDLLQSCSTEIRYQEYTVQGRNFGKPREESAPDRGKRANKGESMAVRTALEEWAVEGHAAIGARVVKHFDGAPYLGQVAGWKGPYDRADGQVAHIARAYCIMHMRACAYLQRPRGVSAT